MITTNIKVTLEMKQNYFFYLRHGDVVLTQAAKCYQNMTTYLFVALKVHFTVMSFVFSS